MELDAETDHSIESVIETEVREKEVRESLDSATDVSAEIRAELKTKLDSAVNVTAEARADIESNVRSTVNSQIDTAKRLINEVEAELNTHSTTSVETRTRGGVNDGSRNGVEVGVDAVLESGSIINTDNLEVESSKTIEGNTTTRIGL